MRKPKETGRVAWHVYARGPRRLCLFYEEEDYRMFLGLLKKALDATGVTMWAYVLMKNHYHFILSATSEQLTDLMRWVNHSYSLYHNRKHGYVGTAFEGPFQSHVQPTLFLLLFRIAYVFLNPVEAHAADRPEDYRWSSYRAFMALPGAPILLDPYPILQLLAGTPGEARRGFLGILDREARRPKRPVADKLTWAQLAQDQFEWLLEEAIRRQALLGGEDPVLVAMYWGRQSGIPPRAMRGALPTGSPQGITQAIRKFARRIEADPERARH
ncbi:MAG TPA: transposase, partial [Planctomycetota bacterium]|nr:transposase [Planctomycetota bacterium]